MAYEIGFSIKFSKEPPYIHITRLRTVGEHIVFSKIMDSPAQAVQVRFA